MSSDVDVDVETGTVRLERTYEAPAEAVFDAWTNPEVLRRWWKASPSWNDAIAEIDLREGGGWRLAMHDPESGQDYVVFGRYHEVSRPDRLVYSWIWEGTGPYAGHESHVAVSFNDDGSGDRTTVVIEHSNLLDATSRDSHGQGWTGVLDQLERSGVLAAR